MGGAVTSLAPRADIQIMDSGGGLDRNSVGLDVRRGMEVGPPMLGETCAGRKLVGLGDVRRGQEDGPNFCGLEGQNLDSAVSPELTMVTSSTGPITVGKKWKKLARNVAAPVEQRMQTAGHTTKLVGKRGRGLRYESLGSSDVSKQNWKLYDETKIGLGLIAFGILFSFLGTILFFDKGLLAMGNILFSSRVTMTMRPKSLMQFFTKCSNFKVGTISFGVGFFLVVIGWIMLGMILEAYGFIVLFRFWPTLSVFVQKIPIIKWVFQQPFVRSARLSCNSI
ncbi:Vesicle transport protein GOT1 [Camellia lanceoleosa]|uniref:Vesicle transport protein GOT1 n=1 Tax=Camellia lanceoleosa TaxID=1840588 RepID=A0ACC0GG86_9ERIC|nr:Vesicle transport protein GOT1 [Camellia lanceoleosa]